MSTQTAVAELQSSLFYPSSSRPGFMFFPAPLMDSKDRCQSPEQPLPAHGGLLPPPAAPSPPSPTRPSPMPYYPGPRGSPLLPHHLGFEKSVYSSPPHASNKPENNQCRLIDYRGAKVAAFSVEGRELICLPQAFDLFLKHLVGGLHTVYTKLKRLGITPVVCNVEQVRILRGLGAIQPGVNRCKLLAPKEFDVLYEDCTNSSSARPGRPPKRAGLGSPDSLQELKKSRPDVSEFYPGHSRLAELKKTSMFSNGFHYPPYQLPFMAPLAHPAMMNLAMASHLGMRPDVIHAREPHRDNEPADLTTPRSHREDKDDTQQRAKDLSNQDLSDKPLNLGLPRLPDPRNGMLPLGGRPGDDLISQASRYNLHDSRGKLSDPDTSDVDEDEESEDDVDDRDGSESEMPNLMTANDYKPHHGEGVLGKPPPYPYAMPPSAPSGQDQQRAGGSPMETILVNILGLLKVAIENARMWEEQIRNEKSQLKMDVLKEKELRQSMEKQLEEEQKHIAMLQKKLKKEKKAARKLHDQMESSQILRTPTDYKPRPEGEQRQDHTPKPDTDIRQSKDETLHPLDMVESRVQQQHPVQPQAQAPPEADNHTKAATHPDSGRSSSDVQTTMESLLMATQRLAADTCHTAANGFIHPPIIKQTEAV